jgi:hypothetical protein
MPTDDDKLYHVKRKFAALLQQFKLPHPLRLYEYIFSLALQPKAGQGHFKVAFLAHTNDTPQSVGPLRMRDRLVAETSTWQHTTLTTQKRTRNPSKRDAADPRLIPVGHWDRLRVLVPNLWSAAHNQVVSGCLIDLVLSTLILLWSSLRF